jgi:Spy/CpxP family protein refolding chaperone
MSRIKPFVAILVVVAASALVIGADEKKEAAKSISLTKPWSQITTLNEEQKVKINDIHLKANAARNEITHKEEADIMAVLSDDQKAELKKVQDAAKAEAKAKKAEAAKEEAK